MPVTSHENPAEEQADSPSKRKRSWLRFSLFTLLKMTTFIAVAIAAVIYNNLWWASGLVGATFIALLATTLTAILSQGRTRASALGFVVFGWVYFAVVFLGISFWSSSVADMLPTTAMIRWYENLENVPVNNNIFISSPKYIFWPEATPRKPIYVIGQCLWTWIIGYAGSFWALFLYARRKDKI